MRWWEGWSRQRSNLTSFIKSCSRTHGNRSLGKSCILSILFFLGSTHKHTGTLKQMQEGVNLLGKNTHLHKHSQRYRQTNSRLHAHRYKDSLTRAYFSSWQVQISHHSFRKCSGNPQRAELSGWALIILNLTESRLQYTRSVSPKLARMERV